jgi:carboxypeptidase PM20D1
MRRVGRAVTLGLVLLLTVLLVRTARFTSRQLPSEPAAHLSVDGAAAAERLAGSLRFRTVSFEDPAQREEELDIGRKIPEGTPDEVRIDPASPKCTSAG